MNIAVDAMGGDFAPRATVDGAFLCVEDPRCDFHITLVGREEALRDALGGRSHPRISLHHASEVIEMGDHPTAALKSKPDSSMTRALELHRDGKVHGALSAGNTGAMLAASTLLLGRLPGVSRPTIGTFLPSRTGTTLLVDAGANVDARPLHLQHFGIMGSIFVREMKGIPEPTVGLLSVGEEEGKGTELITEAHRLLQQAPIRFVGNVEGRDILKGTVDVVVCDGFVGNILLKFAESFPGLLRHALTEYAQSGFFNKLKIGLMVGTLKKTMKSWDYQEHGGVPLLGVKGVSIIGHGSSTPLAIKNMILRAREMAERGIASRIAESIATIHDP